MRTVVDLGMVLQAQQVEDALDRGLISRLYSTPAIEFALADLAKPGRSGAGVIGRILDERALGNDRPDSLLEARMARVLKTYGLVRPDFQHWIKAPGYKRLRVDFCYPDYRLVIEVNGFKYHADLKRTERDMERRNILGFLDYALLEFSWRHVVCRPKWVADTIEAKIAAQLERLGPDNSAIRT